VKLEFRQFLKGEKRGCVSVVYLLASIQSSIHLKITCFGNTVDIK